ncbi:hypothetical protein N8508_00740 [bacterium]|nr:hypothetical protein [bacterium]
MNFSIIADIANIATAVVAVASIVAAVTPTPKDDVWIAKLYSFIDICAINVGKAKQ